MEEENKKRQKELYLKYSQMYEPSNNLILKERIIDISPPKLSIEDERKNKQKATFDKYINLYEPQYNLTSRRPINSMNSLK